MALNAGTRLGAHEIVALIGRGGMGEVYRAHDTKLGRDVALKILPPVFALDPERVARFQREAQLLAALNHPHIAAIYGIEEAPSTGSGQGTSQFLILELVEGGTLAERLAPPDGRAGGAKRPAAIAIDEALAIARQIIDALEAAHDKSIVHRDLKPANIAFTPDGQVKVLDFGLAKAMEPDRDTNVDDSPTMTLGGTRVGTIMGTAAYMSPEQAKGRTADKRSDVWAFGCVLFEMLTGKRAFHGDDVSDTLAAVLRGEPDWAALPPKVPAEVRSVLQRCLEKDRRTRLPDISVARFLMTEKLVPAPTAVKRPTRVLRGRFVTGAVALIVGAALAMVATWSLMRSDPAQPARFTIVPPAALPFLIQGGDRDIAISPDGRNIVYRGGSGQSQLVVRAIDQLEPRVLAGISGVRAPFISPDGHWVGFFTGAGGELKKVSITGGPPITLCRYLGTPRGASWGADETIVFATNDPGTGLFSVPAGGGESKVLTTPDTAKGETDHLFPFILPGGRAVLFTVASQGQADNSLIAVLDLATGERKTLVRGGSQAEYTDTGHIVYAVAGTLRTVRFDLGRLAVVSDPVPVVEQVTMSQTGAAEFALSRTGTLVYIPGTGAGPTGISRSLVWINRQGREEQIKVPPRPYVVPRLSADGTRIALDVRDQEQDIWIWDVTRQTLTRLTFDAANDIWPTWTPDGRRIVFASTRGGVPNLYARAADGTGADERLTTSPNPQLPTSMSSDGRNLVLHDVGSKTGDDLHLLRLEAPLTDLKAGSLRTEPLISTTFNEMAGEISPDGQWLAYYSNESGQLEVYVRPFPKVDSGRWQISTGGGSRPAWARNGKELFYFGLGGASLMSVSVQTAPTFRAGNPAKLFDGPFYSGQAARTYDVSADAQRFLMIKNAAASETSTASQTSLIVVENWFEELKARAGAK